MLKKLQSWFLVVPVRMANTRGSSAIILSVMVSGSVLATIFYNQQNLQWALSSQAESKVKWSDHFVKKYGVTLGAYLVANNLILCKEGGWGNEVETLCKWNGVQPTRPTEEDGGDPESTTGTGDEEDPEPTTGTGDEDKGTPVNPDEKPKEPTDFDLTIEDPKTVTWVDEDGTQQSRKVLQYQSHIQDNSINAGQKVNFTLTFDLVDYNNTAVKGLIGKIPDYVCRNKSTKEIIAGHCVPPSSGSESFQQACHLSATDDTDITDSVCEFITEVDQDYHIVLLTVQVLDKDDKPLGELAHAGIRRPFANVDVEITDMPSCSLTCAISNTPNDNPGCRGDFQPTPNEQPKKIKIKITNKGPGVLYNLSLLRKETPIERRDDNPEEGDPEEGNLEEGDNQPPSARYILIKNVLERAQGGSNKFILPNGSRTFEDTIECKDTFQYEFTSVTIVRRQSQAQQGRNPITIPQRVGSSSTESVNVHAQEYMTLSYTMGSLKQQVCANHPEVLEVCEFDNNNLECHSSSDDNGNGCINADIEPKRGYFPAREGEEVTATTTTTTITTEVRYVSPH